METRRRSARLQVQTANSLNAAPPPPEEPMEVDEEPKKKKKTPPKPRGAKKTTVMKAKPAKSAPKRGAAAARRSKSPTPEDLDSDDVTQKVPKKSANKSEHAMSESSSDEEMEVDAAAPESSNAVKNAPESSSAAPDGQVRRMKITSIARKTCPSMNSRQNGRLYYCEELNMWSVDPNFGGLINAPNSTQNAPNSAQNAPNPAKKASKSAQNAPKPSSAAPESSGARKAQNSAQKAPESVGNAPESSNGVQNAPISAQNAPESSSTAPEGQVRRKKTSFIMRKTCPSMNSRQNDRLYYSEELGRWSVDPNFTGMKKAPESAGNALKPSSAAPESSVAKKAPNSAQNALKSAQNAPKSSSGAPESIKNAPESSNVKNGQKTPKEAEESDEEEEESESEKSGNSENSDQDDDPGSGGNAPGASSSTAPESSGDQNAPKSGGNAPKSSSGAPGSSGTGNAPKSANNAPKPSSTAPESAKNAKNAPKPSSAAPESSRPASTRPRRSVVTTKRVSYVAADDMMELSSSSSSPEDSDSEVDEEIPTKKRAKTQKLASGIPKKKAKTEIYRGESESSEESEDSGDEISEESEISAESDAPGPSNRVSQKAKSRGGRGGAKPRPQSGVDQKDAHWPKCSKASIARKTGNPKNSKTVKSGLRMATKPKPSQPWKKNLEGYEADRKLAKGERRMLEYRKVAHAYAMGKIEEVSYDECFKIHENMKKAYFGGQNILDALNPEKLGNGDQKDRKSQKKPSKSKDSEDSEASDGGNSSEDEWEEMEHFQPVIDDNIEVSIDHEANGDGDEGEGVEKDWWVVYLRQEVNKRIRESWENTHKVHLLCYMAHLKKVVKTALDESLVPSLMMSQLPNGYLKYVGEIIPLDVMKNLVKWFTDAFRPLNGVVSVAAIEQDLLEGHEARYPETSRLTALVDGKCYETDLDRSTLLFCLLKGLETTCRIVVNARTIQRKWDKKQQKQLKEEMDTFRELSRSRSTTPKDSQESSESKTDAPESSDTKKSSKTAKKSVKAPKEFRNYWVEYWQPFEKRWICIDPLHKTVDEPLTIHKDATSPISYVFAVDNRQGICEVSQRYAMDCVKQEFRRRRTDPRWIAWTLSLRPFAANAERKKWEAMQMREDLVKRPLPTIMSEYKNHPLYVLEKDLLKFEAIYPPPESQRPLGQIRGHNVYPRSCVYTLQGENNWLKLARSVKIGEEPYKVVKARPDPRVPVEDRVDQFLNVYGYWQTEKYRRPPLKKGKIPHNDYGNIYMFNENMCPLECVHLKLSGLVQLSRKLNKQCVPAVVGWAFDGGWTHPVIDGAIVLEKDAPQFIKEWEKLESGRAEREEKTRVDRILENWRKLIKGMLRLAYVRKQFGATRPNQKTSKNQKKDSKDSGDQKMDSEGDEEAGPSDTANNDNHIIDNSERMGPLEGFSLDDFINKKK